MMRPLLSDQIDLVAQVDLLRLEASRRLDRGRRSELGQYMTPAPIAELMASLLAGGEQEDVALLDAGAGVGSLVAAAVAALCRRSVPPQSIQITAYEIDETLAGYLRETLCLCQYVARQCGSNLTYELFTRDFIAHVVDQLASPLFAHEQTYTYAILNPPYRKIQTTSHYRRRLQQVGIQTSNLYTGFLSLAMKVLRPGGQLVAITPRSFCNGPYFRPFRELLLQTMALRRVHLFESRTESFGVDDVLQENIILSAIKDDKQPTTVTISTSVGADDDLFTIYDVPYDHVVHPTDPEQFIHLRVDGSDQQIATTVGTFGTTLEDLGLSVSTGRVVDFRASAYLRQAPAEDTVPLIYPTHLEDGRVNWPKLNGKKPNSLAFCAATYSFCVPNGYYVLVKRFSAKEERRRVTAAVYSPDLTATPAVGFENHLNYFHLNGQSIDATLAHGLMAFLNSTIVDRYFRQFSGHTQVNATDLRNLRYPTHEQLMALGRRIGSILPAQSELDTIVSEEITRMAAVSDSDPLRIQERIAEALAILQALGFPRQQRNERSALTLLALLALSPDAPWSSASSPLRGITPMMEFIAEQYGKIYKPNTRETVRRQTVHQFLEAGLIVANPDQPARPVNSPKAVYQIEPAALELLHSYGTGGWDAKLSAYLAHVKTLQQQYAQEREMQRIPVVLPSGQRLTLSPGGQNILIKSILDEFAPRFTPGDEILYLGNTDEKFAYVQESRLRELGVVVEAHGKMPDVIVHHTTKDWIVLIEAVTSHGPIDAKRKGELTTLFRDARPGLVYVTAFLTRQAMGKYLSAISWEPEVWVAESPSHLIHFNGERFLGPY